MKRAIWGALLVIALGQVAYGADAPSVEQGKTLFESSTLGTSGKSCATCHPGGRKLEWAGTMDEAKLTNIINRCIAGPLKGKQLDPASPEMKSLILYLRSLAGM